MTPLLHERLDMSGDGNLRMKDLIGNLEEDEEAEEETTIFFPNGDISSWDILIRWLYHDTIPTLETDTSKTGGWNWNPFAFYALIDHLDIPSLKDKVISALQTGQAKSRMWHVNEQVDWTWAHMKPGCGMWRYLALALVRSILVYNGPKSLGSNPTHTFTVETKEIADLLSKYPTCWWLCWS